MSGAGKRRHKDKGRKKKGKSAKAGKAKSAGKTKSGTERMENIITASDALTPNSRIQPRASKMLGNETGPNLTVLPKPSGSKRSRKMDVIRTGSLDAVADTRGTVASNFSFLTPR